MSNLIPAKMTYQDLADFLRYVADHVEQLDSLEGSIEWLLPEEPFPADSQLDCEVRASIRMNNLNGQGSMRLIGTVP